MSTVVQRSYAPQMRAGLVGMVSDQVEYAMHTRIADVAAGAGIPFGIAVSQSPNMDKGCIPGGTKFIGVTARDITLVGAMIDPLAPDGLFNPLDQYGQKVNVAVLSRGHIWVLAGSGSLAGDGVFYNTANGGFANSASGQAAYGSIQFSKIPADGDTMVINGVTVTFRASGATGDDVNIGPTLGDTLAKTATQLNGSGTAGLAALKYNAIPASPGGAGQGSGADTLWISAKAPGVAGNALAIGAVPAGATKSGATLAGGTAAATAIAGSTWLDSATAGQIARIALGLQV
jgi:hypothetical protein